MNELGQLLAAIIGMAILLIGGVITYALFKEGNTLAGVIAVLVMLGIFGGASEMGDGNG